MRSLIALALAIPFVAGCEAMKANQAATYQDRCQRANWSDVGERDGATSGNQTLLSDRYAYICGDMYNDAAYKQGFDKGFARRPRPTS
ncbi:MAG: hypothetical protein JO292_04885 [Betaproteobacteria bacterium]|nr:hypothetical protein [Betaproteobacteria bacterium]